MATTPTTHLAMRYSPFAGAVLKLMGLGPARSGVWVDQDSVRVALGWGFRSTFLRATVREVGPATQTFLDGWGAHGWRGRWIVNGSSHGLVRLELDPAAQGRVMGVPIRLTQLRVSLTDPAALAALLGGAPRVS